MSVFKKQPTTRADVARWSFAIGITPVLIAVHIWVFQTFIALPVH